MKRNTSLYLDSEVIEELKLRHENISGLVNGFLRTLIVQPTTAVEPSQFDIVKQTSEMAYRAQTEAEIARLGAEMAAANEREDYEASKVYNRKIRQLEKSLQ